MSDADRVPEKDRLHLGTKTGMAALVAVILGSSMAFLDSTIATVAANRIGREFDASFGALQWVLNGYTLPLASLILLGGSLGDRLGRRRIYIVGVAGFAVASLLCAVAPSVGALIAARAVQGVFGALLTPGSLSLITATFHGDDLGKAVGTWSGWSGVSTALGPLAGGWLVDHASWRWAFGINVPLAVAVLVLIKSMPESSSPGPHPRPDILGTVLVAAGLGVLTWGTTEAGDGGWRGFALAATVLGLVILAGFVLVELRSRHPLVPPRLFSDRVFTAANLMTFCTYGALSASIFVMVLHLQASTGYSPLVAGVATLPVTILMLVLSPRAGNLATKIGPRWPMTIGPLLTAAGLALTLRSDADHTNYWIYVFPGVVVFGLGLSALVAPLTSAVMAAAPENDVGIASGVNNAVARTAGLLTVAVLPPLAGLTGAAYQHAGPMTHGYRLVTLMCVALMVLGAVVVALGIRTPAREESTR